VRAEEPVRAEKPARGSRLGRLGRRQPEAEPAEPVKAAEPAKPAKPAKPARVRKAEARENDHVDWVRSLGGGDSIRVGGTEAARHAKPSDAPATPDDEV
jgi:hypothetical protein